MGLHYTHVQNYHSYCEKTKKAVICIFGWLLVLTLQGMMHNELNVGFLNCSLLKMKFNQKQVILHV